MTQNSSKKHNFYTEIQVKQTHYGELVIELRQGEKQARNQAKGAKQENIYHLVQN